MNNKKLWWILGILVVAAVGVVVLTRGSAPAEVTQAPTAETPTSSVGASPALGSPVAPASGPQTPVEPRSGPPPSTVMPGPGAPVAAPKTHFVSYTDAGFSPSTLTVRVGDTVVFQNRSTAAFWPASDPHPAHSGYPTTGGCRSSTFDACAFIPPGGEWSFLFQIAGSWGYHNHLDVGAKGRIIVTR